MNLPTTADQSWLALQKQHVCDEAFAALRRHASTPAQAELLGTALRYALTRGGLDGGVCRMALYLPVLVYEGIKGRADQSAHRLAAALTLLEAGIYTLDHLIDEELDAPLAELPSREVMLGAVCLISHLPYQVLSTTSSSPALIADLGLQLAEGMAKIGAGQLADIAQKSTSSSMLEAVRMKTGERRALFTRLAAILAGGALSQVEAYADFGRALGVARQLRSDLQDIYGEAPSRDLACGARTLPLALYLERATATDMLAMEQLLTTACERPADVQSQVRVRLRDSGVMREVIMLVESHCRLAMQRLETAHPMQRAERLLKELVSAASLLRPRPAI